MGAPNVQPRRCRVGIVDITLAAGAGAGNLYDPGTIGPVGTPVSGTQIVLYGTPIMFRQCRWAAGAAPGELTITPVMSGAVCTGITVASSSGTDTGSIRFEAVLDVE